MKIILLDLLWQYFLCIVFFLEYTKDLRIIVVKKKSTNDALLMSALRGLTIYNFLCIVISQTFFESQVISQSFFESQVISQCLLSLIAVVSYVLNTTPTSSKLSYAHGRRESKYGNCCVLFMCFSQSSFEIYLCCALSIPENWCLRIQNSSKKNVGHVWFSV